MHWLQTSLLIKDGGEVAMDDDRSQNRKPYETPRVTVISLRPEEAVLGNCKSMTSAGPVQSTCHVMGGNCRGIGS